MGGMIVFTIWDWGLTNWGFRAFPQSGIGCYIGDTLKRELQPAYAALRRGKPASNKSQGNMI
jgi:hypothetical protein